MLHGACPRLWPFVSTARHPPLPAQVFEIMSDSQPLGCEGALPQTGYGDNFEHAVSGIFVPPLQTPYGEFGTRSQTVLAVRRDGAAELRERYRNDDGCWKEVRHAFQMDLKAQA
jgi:uncharacterized protein with NRDE domain